MSALENAKNMSVEDILAKTAASGLLEFGVERRLPIILMPRKMRLPQR